MSEKPSFVTSVPLLVNSSNAKQLEKRFDAERQAYNYFLDLCLRRINSLRNSADYSKATQIKRMIAQEKNEVAKKKLQEQRKQLFKGLFTEHGFTKYGIMGATTSLLKSWIGDHLDSKTLEATAKRAFEVSERYFTRQGGRPKFRRKGDLRCIDGKSGSAVQWRGDKVQWGTTRKGVARKPLVLPAIVHREDPIVKHGVDSEVKYTRLVRRHVRSKVRYDAQLVCEGKPFVKSKHKLGQGRVGIDVGVRTIAAVNVDQHQFILEPLVVLESIERKIRVLQRKLDRQRRANNPDCFNEDGTWKKGKRATVVSTRMKMTESSLREASRVQAAYRKCQIGRLCHRLMAMGNEFFMEDVSVKAWQKTFGKSIGGFAPGLFQSQFIKIVENAGGKVHLINTFKTRLSQTCLCGRAKKKKLSEREHVCECGIRWQRDLFSAFLAAFVKNDKLDEAEAMKSWKQGSYHDPSVASSVSNCSSPDLATNQVSLNEKQVERLG